MKMNETSRVITSFLFGILLVFGAVVRSVPADETPPAPRKFTAMAEFSEPGAGTRTIQVGIVINNLTHEQEIDNLKKTLEQGGQPALQSMIRNRAGGLLTLGAVKYRLNLVSAKPSGDGYRYIVVTVRPIKIHERDTEQESLDYPFAVLVFDVDEDGRGEGELYQTAALWVDGSGYVDVENYDGRTGRLTDIEPQR
jgi:hypothetical protein